MNTSDTPTLTDAELKLLQTLVYQECGMHFDERRTSFLEDRLQRRLKECQLDSFYSYYRLLISQQGKQELSRLLENLTVNETSFFRNKAQLDLFQRDVMDDILRRKQARRDYGVRIWSAGCSTGQEPYTIAMLVADAMSYYYLLLHWRETSVKVFGTPRRAKLRRLTNCLQNCGRTWCPSFAVLPLLWHLYFVFLV